MEKLKTRLLSDEVIKVNREPRISLNKLGEYLTATPSRRHKILIDQKYPSSYVTARYKEAEKAIADFLAKNDNDIGILDKALKRIEEKITVTDWAAQTKALNAKAINSFYDITDQFHFNEITSTKANSRASNSILINDVSISIRPDLILKSERKGKTSIGIIKLYFSKNHPLNKTSGEYIASLCMEYLRINNNTCIPSNKLCCVIDIFNQKYFFAPLSYKRRLSDITAACMEISALWSKL